MKLAFNAEMFNLARKINGLTQASLSQISSISQSKLSKIEHGLREPSDEEITILANALYFSKEFFYQHGFIYPPATPFHRKRASLQKKILDRLESVGNLYRLSINKLLASGEIENKIPQLDHDDFGDAGAVARAIRAYFRVPKGPIQNMTQLLEDNGVIVILRNFGTSQFNAFTLIGDGVHPIVFINSQFPGDSIRLSLAHELGHIVMHSLPSPYMEQEAWDFASEFMMPHEEIKPYLLNKKNIKSYLPIKAKWRMSIASLIKRASDLEVVDKNSIRYLWMQMKPYRKHEPLPIGVEEPTLLEEIITEYKTELKYTIEDFCRVLTLTTEQYHEYFSFSERKFTLVK